MKDCKFKQLILDVYKDWGEKTFNRVELGAIRTYNNYFGFLYNAMSTDSLDKILDINKYIDIANPDMLMLHSRLTDKEIEIYKDDLDFYVLHENKLIVYLKNGTEKEFITV